MGYDRYSRKSGRSGNAATRKHIMSIVIADLAIAHMNGIVSARDEPTRRLWSDGLINQESHQLANGRIWLSARSAA